MKWKLEVAMYLLFGLAALPLAWAAFDLLIYYGGHPESLQERETHRDAMILFAILPFTMAVLVPACLAAVYLLALGPNPARAAIVVLAGFYLIVFNLPSPQLPVNTVGNLLWDAATTSLLAVAPLLLMAVRYRRRQKSPNQQLNSDAPQSGAPVS